LIFPVKSHQRSLLFTLVPTVPGGNAYGAEIPPGMRSHAGAWERE